MFRQNDLTIRFLKIHQKLKKDKKFRSNSAFAKSVGYTPQAFNEVEKGRRDIPSHILYNFFKAYRIDPAILFIDEEYEKFLGIEDDSYIYEKYNIPVHPILIDETEKERVVLVDKKAVAGYLNNYQKDTYVKKLPNISLPPGMEHESLYGFEIEGDSMEGNLFEGDWAFCTIVEKLDWIKLNYIYIIVSDEGIAAKRIIEVNQKEKYLLVRSDNRIYPDYKIPLKEIRQIWRLKRSLRGKFPVNEHIKEDIKKIETLLMKVID